MYAENIKEMAAAIPPVDIPPDIPPVDIPSSPSSATEVVCIRKQELLLGKQYLLG